MHDEEREVRLRMEVGDIKASWADKAKSSGRPFATRPVIVASVLTFVVLILLFNVAFIERMGVNPHAVNIKNSLAAADAAKEIETRHISRLNQLKSLLEGSDSNSEIQEEVKKSVLELQSQIQSIKAQLAPAPSALAPVFAVAASFTQDPHVFTKEMLDSMEWEYGSLEKTYPYVGNPQILSRVPKNSRLYKNSLAVFPGAVDNWTYHGRVGLNELGVPHYTPGPQPPELKRNTPDEESAMKRGGGFYIELSDHLSLDRHHPEHRNAVCIDHGKQLLNDPDMYSSFPDTSIIITFYNEPLSTLLRSVHSVLNTSPPHLLREIILVDDHSSLTDDLPGGPLYDAVKGLPKTKLLRLPHRHGLVQARLAGVKIATGDTVTILDSHIECHQSWLEEMMARLAKSPKSLVFPQVPAIDSVDFSYHAFRGIGMQLSFKWVMQEQATAVGHPKNADPIPSASMAGGLFSVWRDFFWHMGGYDERFTMWGAENVEMPFRYWMCGAMVECTPCSRVSHIYRHKGVGYKSPGNSVKVNRLRTAYLWTDEYYLLSKIVIGGDEGVDIGPVDEILSLKERLQCKNFRWFLDTLQPDKTPRHLSDIELLGEIKSQKFKELCLDSLGNKDANMPFGVFSCHGGGGTQAWMSFGDGKILSSLNENMCIRNNSPQFQNCTSSGSDLIFKLDHEHAMLKDATGKNCLTISDERKLLYMPCQDNIPGQRWTFKKFDADVSAYEPPKYSQQWIDEHKKLFSPVKP